MRYYMAVQYSSQNFFYGGGGGGGGGGDTTLVMPTHNQYCQECNTCIVSTIQQPEFHNICSVAALFIQVQYSVYTAEYPNTSTTVQH